MLGCTRQRFLVAVVFIVLNLAFMINRPQTDDPSRSGTSDSRRQVELRKASKQIRETLTAVQPISSELPAAVSAGSQEATTAQLPKALVSNQPTASPTASPSAASKETIKDAEAAAVAAADVADVPFELRTEAQLAIAERAEVLITKHFGRGREDYGPKFYQASRVLGCFFAVVDAWPVQVSLWASHGTALAVLRGQSTPWDGDGDLGFLDSEQHIFDEMFNQANMERWRAEFPVCEGMVPQFPVIDGKTRFRELQDLYTKQGVDLWDFKPWLDGSTEAESQKKWAGPLNASSDEKLLCKWICLKETDIFPLKPCFLNVPMGDTSFGEVTRVERVPLMCGNRFNEGFAKHYPPYANARMHTPFNRYNITSRRWEHSLSLIHI
eukprot:TRINITY_DN14041_c0_g1_i3.p1 TRINITY_DN14041_c0_g1~~TRINITY_DN14041_c0_g1_i3.p1  ORF type:complete len:382 (-),score=57.08 TRINITY_DN14041_c0_g1_i3:123-1268(-)